jgi:ferric-dicitrate binding protein FerR (iron transport regulator)
MRVDPNRTIDTLLLGKYLAGEATPEEAMDIDDWLTDPRNIKEFDEIERIWNSLSAGSIHEQPDLADGWLRLKNTLPVKKQAKLVRLLLNRYTIAASLLAIFIYTAFTWLTHDNNPRPAGWKYITKGSFENTLKDRLPDGSEVIISRNSTIQYTEDFNKPDRKLSLNGESYFNIVPSRERPFIISVDKLKIKVVGTSFNVKKTNHPDIIEVQVQSGLVKMYTDAKEITVKKGQTGTYTIESGEFNLKDTVDVNSLSYATSNFSFNDMSLARISVYLEKAFGVTILADNNKLLQCRLTAQFENKSLTYIMDVIAATLNIEYSIQGNSVSIKGKGCN